MIHAKECAPIPLSAVHTLSNTRASRLFFYGLAFAYASLLLVYLSLSHYQDLVGVAILIGLYVLRHSRRIMRHRGYPLLAAASPVVEIVLLFLLFFGKGTEVENIVFVLFIADLLLHYKSWYAFPFAYAGYLVYMILWPPDGNDLWSPMFHVLSYSFLIVPIWSTKLLLNQREVNLRLNESLKQEARTREEMAALKERTRIAEEVHDTVGHTLTTAIVALEGAQLLFEKRPEESLRKIRVAREQLKEGLGNIRQVAKTLKATEGTVGDLELEEGIRKIMTDAERQTDVRFTLHLEELPHLVSVQKYVILNLIKESITNALKHGRASAIGISIMEERDTIHIRVEDNGGGSDAWAYGFGLKTMEERIEAIGGQLTLHSEAKGGFALHARMPIAGGEA
ncbi:sensor histidine kinase [Saccharibacillus deserti]|uniref:sensor histidine kinase n=1 Tax=Saccharibacillus deserti TaxID=1634444 RepID=UPI001551C2A2|nr:sensor histidine kinase [Saccharibacillus deserti]